jgi:hypothetical protein
MLIRVRGVVTCAFVAAPVGTNINDNLKSIFCIFCDCDLIYIRISVQHSIFLQVVWDGILKSFRPKPFLGEQATLISVCPITQQSCHSFTYRMRFCQSLHLPLETLIAYQDRASVLVRQPQRHSTRNWLPYITLHCPVVHTPWRWTSRHKCARHLTARSQKFPNFS